MITEDTAIWTKRGWQYVSNCYVGDTVISFDPVKNHTVYDKITSIETDYKDTGVLGIRAKTMWQTITPDHPILVYGPKDKSLTRSPIRDIFHASLINSKSVIYNKWFEPYKSNPDPELILRSARKAATYAQSKYFDCYEEVRKVTDEITGVDAQAWLDAFFHWNVLAFSGKNWAKSIYIRNTLLRDVIFNVGARAGVGVFNQRFSNLWLIRITTGTNINISNQAGWIQDTKKGLFYNISTRNGSFLSRRGFGSFISACAIDGE